LPLRYWLYPVKIRVNYIQDGTVLLNLKRKATAYRQMPLNISILRGQMTVQKLILLNTKIKQMDNNLIRISYLLTGKTGMCKAIWNKFKPADFAATFKEANRDMNGYEAAILELDATDGIEGHKLLRDTIGKKLIANYDINTI